MYTTKQNNWMLPILVHLVGFSLMCLIIMIGYIVLFFFFKYFGVNSAIPFYTRDLIQIGSVPVLWTVLLCYPSLLSKLENNKVVKIVVSIISIFLLYAVYAEAFFEHRLIVFRFALILHAIGIYLRKTIYRFRYIIFPFSLIVLVSTFITLHTDFRLQFNIVDYQEETYAIIQLIEGNAYLVRGEIEPINDTQNSDTIIHLFRNEFQTVNVFDSDIMGDNITRFSKVILEDR